MAAVMIGLQSCEFYNGKDFVRDGASQSDLRALLCQQASLELTENEKILNAYSDTGRDPTLWFEVSFDPNRSESLKKMLLQNGYVVNTRKRSPMPSIAPPRIAQWWSPIVTDGTILFTLVRDKEHPDSEGVWCFFSAETGKLFGFSFTH